MPSIMRIILSLSYLSVFPFSLILTPNMVLVGIFNASTHIILQFLFIFFLIFDRWSLFIDLISLLIDLHFSSSRLFVDPFLLVSMAESQPIDLYTLQSSIIQDWSSFLILWLRLGLEVSQVEPEIGIAQPRLDSIKLGSWLGSITNKLDFKAQARLAKSSSSSS